MLFVLLTDRSERRREIRTLDMMLTGVRAKDKWSGL